MQRHLRKAALACLAAGFAQSATAQAVCDGVVVFQCATDAEPREQITVCAQDARFSLVRHALETGEPYDDTPLIAEAATTWFSWQEGDDLRVELGFWSTDLGEPVTLHASLPWDDMEEAVAQDGPAEMWLQSAHWQQDSDQTPCLSQTVYADTEALWAPLETRGPIGLFFSQDVVVPEPNAVGVAEVMPLPSGEGLAVYATARPNAATPVWWQLYEGDTVDVIAREGDFLAVAIPTYGVTACLIRPEQLYTPYQGPCATGWVDGTYLDRVQ
ncbi:hypothetical protein HCZ23_10955 [Celeribacter sp. HF31]|uniref:hypothetical protein n=1 Tax=Celeribacter sp. HF31 TaxID=2721558 RepID=UPI00142FEB3A|nr:hypothetical protein [Celeribacter sp. HF31]NIY79983.1 hypothetical protein [Celeribacter sp. HF31]